MQESISDKEKNLEFNRNRWGKAENWTGKDQFGYRWGGGAQQTIGHIADIADDLLRPHLGGRRDLAILELSPGGGRFTAELIRYASTMDLLDMNQACLDVCRERFKYYPVPMRFFLNDGQSVEMLDRDDYELIACFDSAVHMHPEIIRGYVLQFSKRLRPGGILWIDHSGSGPADSGHRTDMTPEKMAGFAAEAGLTVVAQPFRNRHDCISIMSQPL
ncbi:methyltransferase family protein [Neorhizobium sp. R1-B]|uniref:class I SAM-dependent methyltransferase n=1 Tax=unclassified Neorhizobium TaxID=2629175 RepID=UPI000DD9297A|nr:MULTISPECIES: class I SAM-dependent methyltransferase [unclassified Neorhizobium]TCV66267.1 methyltransferase family protein [Neorhizobium sp. S3-V5DH]TDX72589.1 methyltransferase family protein [Neorhizobium sp. R1-B]